MPRSSMTGEHLGANVSEEIISFVVPGATILLNELMRLHYHERTKRKHALAWAVKLASRGLIPPEPLRRAAVRIERHGSGRLPDYDGLVGGMKHLLDILQPFHAKHRPYGLGFIADDSPAVIDLTPVARSCGHGAEHTVVEIRPL